MKLYTLEPYLIQAELVREDSAINFLVCTIKSPTLTQNFMKF